MNLTAEQIITQMQSQIADYAKMLAVSNATVEAYKEKVSELEGTINDTKTKKTTEK